MAGGPPNIICTYLIYHLYTLCVYTTIYSCMYVHIWPAARNVKNPPANNYATSMFNRISSHSSQRTLTPSETHDLNSEYHVSATSNASFLVKILGRSPQNILIFIISIKYFLDKSVQQTVYLILKKESLASSCHRDPCRFKHLAPRPVLPLQPKYRLAHPENYLYYYSFAHWP